MHEVSIMGSCIRMTLTDAEYEALRNQTPRQKSAEEKHALYERMERDAKRIMRL